MIYFWADTHFNHAGILRYCGRPFVSVAEMNYALVEAWNAVVRTRDTIYLLGDFAFASKDGTDVPTLFARLQGYKHLVTGNHDEKNPAVLKLPWESISSLRTVKDNGMRAEVCHYPLATWKRADRGALMLHGHSHGTLKQVAAHRFDVGADVRSRPVSFEQLWAEAAAQPFVPADHHGDL